MKLRQFQKLGLEVIFLVGDFTGMIGGPTDNLATRLKENKPIRLHEFLYPVAQAVDCVEMNVDLEIGGSDQIFNMLTGRTLMKAIKNKEKFVLATKLLVDSKGE